MRYYEEDYDREDSKQSSQKSTASKQSGTLSKEELINAIMEEDPKRDKELLETFSEFLLKRTLKQILDTKKRGLTSVRDKSYENPFEKYDREQDERFERQGRSF